MMAIVGKAAEIGGKIWNMFMIAGAVGLLAMKFVPMFFGYEAVICMSDSMSPSFHKNALCYIDRDYDSREVQEGDVIAFRLKNGELVSHRAAGRTEEGNIITKGDANEQADTVPVKLEQIIGKNILQIEKIGILFHKFPNWVLIRLVLSAFLIDLFFSLTGKVFCDREGNENEKTDDGDPSDRFITGR